MSLDRVNLSEELSSFVTERISRYEHDRAENQDWLVPYVKKFNILPLWSAWLETVGVQPDGSVRKFSADGDHTEYEGLRHVEERAIFIHSLLEGSRRYPQLQQAVPQRPPEASVCPQCNGKSLAHPGHHLHLRGHWLDPLSVLPNYSLKRTVADGLR
jgi:hypothetical protein